MLKGILISVVFTLTLSGCSSMKQLLSTAGSIAGAAYARDKGENAWVGSFVGGMVGNLAGQMITQARPY